MQVLGRGGAGAREEVKWVLKLKVEGVLKKLGGRKLSDDLRVSRTKGGNGKGNFKVIEK